MADDTQRLVVSLEARIDSFEKALKRAGAIADDSTTQIQKKFDNANGKLVLGMSRIGKTALVANDANARLVKGMSQTADGAVGVSDAIGALSTQGMAAFHALRGGAEQLAQGASPLRVLAMEMNNLTYAASGTGGLKGAFSEAIGIFRAMLNPVALLTTGIIGSALAVVGLGASFAKSQAKIDTALTGVGKAAGMTVGQINQISEAVSKSGDISTSEASDIATTIASTGRASADATQKATALAHAYSLVFNKDLPSSAHDLAAALADPAKGIDVLNERLGEWDASQVQLIKTLDASGNKSAAQQIILEGLKDAFSDVEKQTTLWGNALNFVGNKLSNLYTASGKALNKAAGNQSPEDALVDQLSEAKEKLSELQGGHFNLFGGISFGDTAEIKKTSDQIDELTAKLDALRKAGADVSESVYINNLANSIDPVFAQLNALDATFARLKKDFSDPSQIALMSPEQLTLLQHALAITQNLISLRNEYIAKGDGNPDLGQLRTQNDLDLQSIKARSPAEKAELAYQQELLSLREQGKDYITATQGAELAKNKSLADSYEQLKRAAEDREAQRQISIKNAQTELDATGLDIGARTELTTRNQQLAQAEEEARKNHTLVDQKEIDKINAAAKATGDLARSEAARTAQQGAKFDISQLGRDQQEQNVYSTLQGAGLLDNGEIVSAQAKQTAAILRTKEALSDLADTEKTFASSFLSDLVAGKSAATALGDALTAVANKLLDKGIDALIASATSSGVNGGILSAFGFAAGGTVRGPGSGQSDSIPAMLSNGEEVINADAARKNRPLLKAINAGKVGKFAMGGTVGSIPALPRISAPVPSARSSNFSISIDARNSTPQAVSDLNTKTLPQLEKIIDQRIGRQIGRSASVKKMIRNA